MEISFRYFRTHAPWAFVGTFAVGIGGYLITIVLAKYYGAEALGTFRIVLATLGILSLSSLLETNKIFLANVVGGKGNTIRSLFWFRVKYALFGLLAGIGLAAYYHYQGDPIAGLILLSALVMPLCVPSELFEPANQGRKRFRAVAMIAIFRSSVLGATVLLCGMLGLELFLVVVIYLLTLTLANTSIFLWMSQDFKPFTASDTQQRSESFNLSLSSVFSNILEHIDKLLISYFLGLEALGIYVIGVSTGRLLLFAFKPALSVLSPLLVTERLGKGLILAVLVGGTIAGVIASLVFEPVFNTLFDRQYEDAFQLSRIILVSLGIYSVGILLYNSAVFHQDTPISIPVLNNLISPVLVLLYLVVAGFFAGDNAPVFFALSYPLRHLVNAVVLISLSRRHRQAFASDIV